MTTVLLGRTPPSGAIHEVLCCHTTLTVNTATSTSTARLPPSASTLVLSVSPWIVATALGKSYPCICPVYLVHIRRIALGTSANSLSLVATREPSALVTLRFVSLTAWDVIVLSNPGLDLRGVVLRVTSLACSPGLS